MSKTVHWIATEILSESSSKKRASNLSTFLAIGNVRFLFKLSNRKIFIKMENYHGVAKIFRALTLPFIARLQKTWKLLSPADRFLSTTIMYELL